MAVRPGSTPTENSRGTENLVHSAMPSPHSPSKPSLPEVMSLGHRHSLLREFMLPNVSEGLW